MTQITNRTMGNSFEHEFCEILADEGFWCHNMAQNASGQPADVIAVIDKKPYLIDCKVCKNDRFAFSRIEENQSSAMKYWDYCGNGVGWFALKTSAGIYMLSFPLLDQISRKTKKSLSLNDICKYGTSLDRWMQGVSKRGH